MDAAEHDELKRAEAEADAAEAELRRMKENLIPRDRINALRQLLFAEAGAMMNSELNKFVDRVVAVSTEEEAARLTAEMSAAIAAGLDKVQATVNEQAKAWTLAALEDRAREGNST